MRKHLLFTGRLMMFFAVLLFITNGVFADIVISSGSSLKVSSGTTVVLSGDFTNNGTADLGDGTVIFNGTAAQEIGGTTTTEFGNVQLNNAAGLSLSVDAQVDGTLTLTSGVLDIDNNALIFAATANAVSGTFSASNMILADDPTGQVRRAFNDGTVNPSGFFFPIGSDDGTAEYSPVEIDFNSSTFSSAYVGVRVTPAVEPNNSSTDSYLERYWTIENVGITAYTYDLTATYVNADINSGGTEADISGALYNTGGNWMIGDPVNTGNNTFFLDDFDDVGNATGVDFRILSNLGIVIEGAYNDATNEMTTALNGDLPLNAATAYAEYGYAGTESVGAIPSADIVDWILVEVRDATTAANASSATIAETVAGFLLKDGSIVGLDGFSPLTFKALIVNNAYFVVRHRNHLDVMTSTSPTESFGSYIYDFSDNLSKAYNSFPADPSMVQVDTSPVVYALFAGETNTSDFITVADKVPIQADMDFIGYHIADCNFSGIVTVADKVPIQRNMDMYSHVPF